MAGRLLLVTDQSCSGKTAILESTSLQGRLLSSEQSCGQHLSIYLQLMADQHHIATAWQALRYSSPKWRVDKTHSDHACEPLTADDTKLCRQSLEPVSCDIAVCLMP